MAAHDPENYVVELNTLKWHDLQGNLVQTTARQALQHPCARTLAVLPDQEAVSIETPVWLWRPPAPSNCRQLG